MVSRRVDYWLGLFLLSLVYGTFSVYVLQPHHINALLRFFIGFALGIMYNRWMLKGQKQNEQN